MSKKQLVFHSAFTQSPAHYTVKPHTIPNTGNHLLHLLCKHKSLGHAAVLPALSIWETCDRYKTVCHNMENVWGEKCGKEV